MYAPHPPATLGIATPPPPDVRLTRLVYRSNNQILDTMAGLTSRLNAQISLARCDLNAAANAWAGPQYQLVA